MSSILDIPDDPPRQYRGTPLAVGAGVVWIVAGIGLSRTFALGGFASPHLAIGVVVAIPAMTLAWVCAGPLPQRLWLAVGVMVLALASIPLASAGATYSTGRLVSMANGFDFPGRVAHDVKIGSGRCRPACSELRRTAFVTDVSFVKARSTVIGALKSRGFVVREYARAAGAPLRIDATSKKLLVSIEMRDLTAIRTRIASVYLAQGPAPDHSVGEN